MPACVQHMYSWPTSALRVHCGHRLAGSACAAADHKMLRFLAPNDCCRLLWQFQAAVPAPRSPAQCFVVSPCTVQCFVCSLCTVGFRYHAAWWPCHTQAGFILSTSCYLCCVLCAEHSLCAGVGGRWRCRWADGRLLCSTGGSKGGAKPRQPQQLHWREPQHRLARAGMPCAQVLQAAAAAEAELAVHVVGVPVRLGAVGVCVLARPASRQPAWLPCT